MGTPNFAVPALDALHAHGENIVAVVTQPDRPKGRGRKLTPSPVKKLAGRFGIPLLQPKKLKDGDFLAQLITFQPDLIIVAAYGRILPGKLLNMPPLGTINIHGSLLPKYRGAAPIQWALINGETTTGVTIMQMDEGLDTGDILLQEKLLIDQHDTTGTLMNKMAELGGHALIKAIDLLHDDRLVRFKQDDRQATLAPPLTKELGEVDWNKSALEISCLVRGLDPWPLTYVLVDGKRLKIFSPKVIDFSSECSFIEKETAAQGLIIEPGMLCRADADGLVIATGKGYLLIQEVQPEGGRRMPADAYLRGRPLKTGTRLIA